jgi:Flp pilus assembly protein TadD
VTSPVSWERSPWQAGRELIAAGRVQDAVKVLKAVVSENPQSAGAFAYLADAELKLRNMTEARYAAERAVALAPESWWAHGLLARALAYSGEPKLAIMTAAKAVQLGPDTFFTHDTQAWVLLESRNLEGALAAARHAVGIAPERFETHRTLGTVLLRLGSPVQAEAAYRQALSINPLDARALNDLAISLKQQGRRAEAVGNFERAARASPANSLVQRNLQRQRIGPSRHHLSPQARQLIADTRRSRRFKPRRWDWQLITRLRLTPFYWQWLLKLSPQRALAVNTAALGLAAGLTTLTPSAWILACAAGITLIFSTRRLIRWRRATKLLRPTRT